MSWQRVGRIAGRESLITLLLLFLCVEHVAFGGENDLFAELRTFELNQAIQRASPAKCGFSRYIDSCNRFQCVGRPTTGRWGVPSGGSRLDCR